MLIGFSAELHCNVVSWLWRRTEVLLYPVSIHSSCQSRRISGAGVNSLSYVTYVSRPYCWPHTCQFYLQLCSFPSVVNPNNLSSSVSMVSQLWRTKQNRGDWSKRLQWLSEGVLIDSYGNLYLFPWFWDKLRGSQLTESPNVYKCIASVRYIVPLKKAELFTYQHFDDISHSLYPHHCSEILK